MNSTSNCDLIPEWNPNRYSLKRFLASGSFGAVHEGYDNVNRQSVAIKSIMVKGKNGYKAAYRELCILNRMRSHYLLQLLDAQKYTNNDNLTLWLVLPLMEYDLHSFLYKKKLIFSFRNIIEIFYQILKGLQYLYEAGVIHRDLKPSNIGINSNYDLKILDFGMSREKEENMTRDVTTQYYRAIEVFSEANYTTAIDMWSAGCIFVELFTREVLFKGKKVFDQIKQITSITGIPTGKTFSFIERFRNTAPNESQIKKHIKNKIKSFGCYIDDDENGYDGSENVIELICDMLQLDPEKRPTPIDALNSSLFKRYFTVVNRYADDVTAQPLMTYDTEDTLQYFQEKVIEEIGKVGNE